MVQKSTAKIRFEILQPWIADIFQEIKRDLRNDHLLKSPSFVQKHFPRRALDKLTAAELAVAYVQEIGEGAEDLAEKVVTLWVMKNAELYYFFASILAEINPQFDEIESIPSEDSSRLLNGSVQKFGARATYLFCVMNTVVVSEEQLSRLRELALDDKLSSKEEERSFETVDALREHYEKEIRKLSEKYEKRMQGLERKYTVDVDGLKKQIAQLHKKMSGHG